MNRNIASLSALAIVAFGLRLAACVHFGLSEAPQSPDDAYEYCRYASNLVHGRGYVGPEPGAKGEVRSAYLPPGTPALFAATFGVAGENFAALRIVNCLISTASVLLLFALADGVGGRRSAWIAAGMFAVWPSALYYCHTLLTETPYVFLVILWGLLCQRWFAPRPTALRAAVIGLVLGVTILVRPTILIFVPFFLAWCAYVLPRFIPGLIYAAIVVTAAGLVVAPWTWRNYQVYERFVLVAPVSWTVFIQGNNSVVLNDPKLAGYCVWYTEIPEYAGRFEGLSQIEREPLARELSLAFLRENRGRLWRLEVNKFLRFWTPLLKQDSRLVRLTMLVSWGSVLVLFVPAYFVTLFQFARRRDPALWMHLFIVAALVQCLIYFGLPRYRYPIEPFCLVFAALCINALGAAWWQLGGRNDAAVIAN